MANCQEILENDKVKITKWTFEPGGETGWHEHDYDYVVVPLLDGDLDLADGYGETTTASLKAGVPYFKNKGVKHNVINANSFEFSFIEIELLN